MRKKYRLTAALSAFSVAAFSFIIPVFAAVGTTEEAVQYAYSLVVKLCIPIAVIALAACAFTLFSGSDKAIDQLPSRIKYLACAICGLFLLGMLINWGSSLGQRDDSGDIAWNPEGGNTIVSDTVPGADLSNLVGIVNAGTETETETETE